MSTDLAAIIPTKIPSLLILTLDRQIDRRILQQADSLTAAGWSVTILAMPRINPMQVDDARVIRVTTSANRVGLKNALLMRLYQLINRTLTMNGVLMRVCKQFAWAYLVNQEEFYLKLFQPKLNDYAPDVVMAVDLPMLPVAMAIVRSCGAKLVYDSHELYAEQAFSKTESAKWKKIEAKYIPFCQVVMTINPAIAAELARRYSIPPVHVIYNAVNQSMTSTRTKLFHAFFSLPAERKILLFQGGLSNDRHLETVVKAMRYVNNPLVTLVIMGDGQLIHKLMRITQSKRLQQRVYFKPAVPQAVLLDYTQAADAGLIPYQATCLNNYYCTPNKLFEFISAGIPILANALPEIKRIVDENQIGLTGTMSTPREVGALIDDFFSSPSRLETWRHHVSLAQERIGWHQEEKKLLAIFESLR